MLAVNASGSVTQQSSMSQGIFRFTQSTTRALTTLTLRGRLARRTRAASSKDVTAAGRRSRRLFTRSRGSFRTRTRHSSATTRGTDWLTEESSAGTLTKVKTGSVVVQDFVARRRVVVRARGEVRGRYFARARARARARREPGFTG